MTSVKENKFLFTFFSGGEDVGDKTRTLHILSMHSTPELHAPAKSILRAPYM
jgi:hypothetical protein